MEIGYRQILVTITQLVEEISGPKYDLIKGYRILYQKGYRMLFLK